jgi:hypothetical protein
MRNASLLLRNQIATPDDLQHALGTPVDVTVFRKPKPLDYLGSYSHRGRFYTLRELALRRPQLRGGLQGGHDRRQPGTSEETNGEAAPRRPHDRAAPPRLSI